MTDPDGSKRRCHLHRLVMEKHLGRRLERNEHVHHVDHNQLNNELENLILIDSKEHARMHSPMRKRKNGRYA